MLMDLSELFTAAGNSCPATLRAAFPLGMHICKTGYLASCKASSFIWTILKYVPFPAILSSAI
ncbi:hypothetical protein SAMN05216299_11846 [Nitrosospira sp. Nsp14]|nr:hypothetical protein SAMN05216299_11846 [Nitrosospira sp. Nsp14]